MTVEDRRGGKNQFPAGLRVLAVDDDPVCLKMLEVLLQRCQYNVTTTNQAITALKMLREKSDKFDLVISDVQMPDMDGFKLLELVGLEMDLPVIMMSGNGDTQNVMKGISHGACDYLLKPVRMEELKNIWQHVIRRKKFDSKDHKIVTEGEDDQKVQNANSGSDPGATDNGNLNKKRKEQDEDEDEDDGEDNTQGAEENGTQKKPRVVWTVDLHRKFVTAVNQLGIDKAVPKKILDHMNVENLTRENVASHLQKYRLYLKRLSTAASQGFMTTAIGNRSSYFNLSPLNGYRNYHALGGSRQLPALTSLKSHGVLGRMNNNPPVLGKDESLPSQAVRFSDMFRNASNSISDFRKLQGINLPGNHQGTLFPRVSTTVEPKRMQQSETVQEVKSQLSPALSGVGVAPGLSRNPFAGVLNNCQMLQPDKQLDQSGGLSNTLLAGMSNLDSFKIGAGEFPQINNLIRCDNAWQGTATSTGVSSNPLSMLGQINSKHFSRGDSTNNISLVTSHNHNSLPGDPLCGMASAPQQDPLMRNQHLTGSTIAFAKGVDEKDQFSNLTILDNSRPKWDDTFHSDHISRTSSSSSFPDVLVNDTTAEYQMSENDLLVGQEPFGNIAFTQNCAVDDNQLNYGDEFVFECSEWKSDLGTSGCSLDELVNSMMKQGQDYGKQMDADLGSDMYNLDNGESERRSGDGKES